jgi:hypothetical protein
MSGSNDAPSNDGPEDSSATENDDNIDGLFGPDDKPAPSNDDDLGFTDSATPLSVEIKAAKGMHKFDLRPDNEELIRTLQQGVGARQAVAEAAKYRKLYEDAQKEKATYAETQKKADLLTEITALSEQGYTAQAIKALLGNKYEDFRKQEILGTIDYESASPDERYEMDKARAEREKQWEIGQRDKKLAEYERRLKEREEKAEEDKWHAIGEKLASKYDMSSFISDPELAEEANADLWKNVWLTLGERHPDMQTWTPTLLEKVWQQKARVARGGMEHQVEKRLEKATEAKKEAALTQAQAVARKNYTASKGSSTIREELSQAKSGVDRLDILRKLGLG